MKHGVKIGKFEIPHHGILISILLLGATFFVGFKSYEISSSNLDASEKSLGPVYLSATLESCDKTAEISLSWTLSSNADGYVVQKKVHDKEWLKIYETSGLYPQLTQVIEESETMYQVTARNSAHSSASNIVDTSSLFFTCQDSLN